MNMLKNPGIRTAVVIALVGMLLVVGFWILNFKNYELSQDSIRWAEFGGFLGGTLGPLLAFASFIGLLVSVDRQAESQAEQKSRADSEIYRKNATKNLERAYAEFMGGDDSTIPVSDRLVWLTVARLILSAKSISEKIEIESIKEMYDADEEHWRHRFYDVLCPITTNNVMNDQKYFREGEKELSGYVIDERSIRVIYEFSEWPDEKSDPIDEVDKYTDEEIAGMKISRNGLKEYLLSLR